MADSQVNALAEEESPHVEILLEDDLAPPSNERRNKRRNKRRNRRRNRRRGIPDGANRVRI